MAAQRSESCVPRRQVKRQQERAEILGHGSGSKKLSLGKPKVYNSPGLPRPNGTTGSDLPPSE